MSLVEDLNSSDKLRDSQKNATNSTFFIDAGADVPSGIVANA